ncbi:EamA family transporter [Vibrio diazotrophicus]|uniref:EamA family transporter n=2 Tax=Vibrio diazotrophicus TaxID=685 RepID=A0A2J8HUC4_VIBDI|nr:MULTISPECIES: EamA family transporter [Vibrio]PNI01791.1 EamA family transporter [Vibrio diazotrophicus]RAS57196.1 inner membrane transporter RhtA [Vibrio diazotrophicus]TNC11796.1 EamA family transporter [Vibrio diabolicus]
MQPIPRLSMTAAFASLLSLQVGAAFAKTIFPLVGPEGVAALRIGITALILGLMIRPWTLKIERSAFPNVIMYGGMIGLMNILIYRAFHHIPVGIAISIEVLGPLGVSLLSTKRKSDIVWIGFALFGVMMLPFGLSSFSLDIIGVLYAVLAAISWGIYISYASKIAHIGAGGVSIGMIVAALFSVPIGVTQIGLPLFKPEVLALGLIVAILSSTIPFLLDVYALKNLPKSIFGVLMSASPAVSAIAGWFILDEQLSSIQWTGIFAISIACIGASLPAYVSAKPV